MLEMYIKIIFKLLHSIKLIIFSSIIIHLETKSRLLTDKVLYDCAKARKYQTTKRPLIP
jgi:hypothetical protein